MNTLEVGEAKKFNSVRRAEGGDKNRLQVSYLYEVGEIRYNENTGKFSNYTKLFETQNTSRFTQPSMAIDDFMMFDDTIGVVKFMNN